MSQKDKVLGILERSVQIFHLGLDLMDPKTKSISKLKFKQIRDLACEIHKEAQELP